MTWLRRYRIRSFLRNSVWFLPVLGMLLALLADHLACNLDNWLGWEAEISIEGGRVVLSALVSAMLSFLVFVFSMLLVAVQIASSQFSPRIIATAFRERLPKVVLAIFVFTFTYSLLVLVRIEQSVPQFSAWISRYANLVSLAAYLFLFDHFCRMLRPVGLLARIAAETRVVIDEVYPLRLGSGAPAAEAEPAQQPQPPAQVHERASDGVFLAFDPRGLVAWARRSECVLEIAPQVGDFVAKGSPLIFIYGRAPASTRALDEMMAFGPERTVEQDPVFGFRILVDIALKALSPGINDPTTAVLALDQLHQLLRTVGLRRLDTGTVYDAEGKLRLVYRTPDWEDFVRLAVTEVRHCGGSSIQVARRMRAMLEDLIRVLPPDRSKCLRGELDLLHRSVTREFLEPVDRVRAETGDTQGLSGRTTR